MATFNAIPIHDSKRMDGDTVLSCLLLWQAVHGLGKKPTTLRFHREIIETIKRNLPGLDRHPSTLLSHDIAAFAQKVAHYAPSRWNAMVSVLREVTGQPKLLKYRKLRFRDFKPPRQEEFTALLMECDSAPRSHCGLVVRLLALTGLRIAEARKLQWAHIGEDEIALPGAVTKNGKPRAIPLLPGAREILSRLRLVSAGDFVLPCTDIRTALRKACHRAGLARWSNHSFRHHFATSCIISGVDIPTVSRWLGHSDGGSLLSRTYYHLTTDHSRRMAEKVRIAV